MSSLSNQTDSYKTYFYTDRPVYRLGQTVCFKGITRKQAPEGPTNPGKDIPVHVSVEDPENNELWNKDLTTSGHGTFHGLYSIPDDAKTGSYQLHITYDDGSVDYESFQVEQYRKPEYQVDVTPLTPRVVAGARCRARIHAAYYFGAPVANARVKYSIFSSCDWSSRYRLMPRPSYCEFFDDWDNTDSDDGGYSGSDGGDFITDGFTQTDANGEAIVEFDTKAQSEQQNQPYSQSEFCDKRYRVEAEVTDISRLSVTSSASSLVTSGNFAVFVQPQDYVVRAGDSMACDIHAIDYDGKPVTNEPVTVKLMRWIWDRAKSEYRGSEVETQLNVTTDSQGKATAELKGKTQWPSDTFYVTAEAADTSGHKIFDSQSIWIANANCPYVRYGQEAQKETMSVKLDKKVYEPGDTAKVMITSPLTGNEGADAIVSVEAGKIFDYRVVPITATAQFVEVPIKPMYAPNVFVTVTLIGKGHQFYNVEKMVRVSPEANFVNITVSSDKAQYKPGESARYTLTATHPDGKPAPDCELSLGVVDESIYAIRPDATENIRKFFYSPRSNSVSTTCSFPQEYSGGPDKMQPRVRKNFRDTAAWLPELITDKNGKATATVKLPDNLTTWRATVRGIDMATCVGAATQKIIVTQDLILRLALPRFSLRVTKGSSRR